MYQQGPQDRSWLKADNSKLLEGGPHPMNKLTFRVAVEEARSHGYHSIIPGMMVCGTGESVEETLENTKSVILDYMPDSVAAVNAFGMGGNQDFSHATWHIIEILR